MKPKQKNVHIYETMFRKYILSFKNCEDYRFHIDNLNTKIYLLFTIIR